MRKREKFKIPSTGLVILAIDILIIIGMLVFIRFYYREAPISSHTYMGIEYRLIAKPLNDGELDYKINLSMKNKGEEKRRLSFKVPMCEFIIKRGEKEVWKRGIGDKEGITLDSGQSYEFVSLWNQQDMEGRIVEAGEYRVIARINHNPSYSIAIRIRLRE